MTRTPVLGKNGQMALDLPTRTLFGRQDFFVAPCNREAVTLIDGIPNGFSGALIYGPHGSGKTHLAHLFADKAFRMSGKNAVFKTSQDLREADVGEIFQTSPYVVIENAGVNDDETALFHLLNGARDAGGFVLLTSETPYTRWDVTLPDLRSRLSALPVVGLGLPDDTVMRAVTLKLFADRQLDVSPDAVDYILKNVDRSFSAVCSLVDAADKLSLAEKKQISIPLLRRFFQKAD